MKNKLLLIPIPFLILAIGPWPAWYYVLLEILVCPYAAYFGYKAYKKKDVQWACIFGGMAVLYNPIFPIYLYSKFAWIILNILSSIFIYNYYSNKL